MNMLKKNNNNNKVNPRSRNEFYNSKEGRMTEEGDAAVTGGTA